MTARTDPCGECEAAALNRVGVATDVLTAVLWAELDPIRGVSAAMNSLREAEASFRAAGFE
jgi:hypothetical protein